MIPNIIYDFDVVMIPQSIPFDQKKIISNKKLRTARGCTESSTKCLRSPQNYCSLVQNNLAVIRRLEQIVVHSLKEC